LSILNGQYDRGTITVTETKTIVSSNNKIINLLPSKHFTAMLVRSFILTFVAFFSFVCFVLFAR